MSIDKELDQILKEMEERSCLEESKEAYEDRKRKEEEIMISEKIRSSIPRAYYNLETDKKELLKEMESKSLFIYSNQTGNGKTTFACDMAKSAIRKGGMVKYISLPKFIMEVQCSYKDGNPYDIVENIASYWGMLIIDDLGAEKMTDFVKQVIYFIINEREQNCRQTIITSNYSVSQLDKIIDCRISSRIAGMCEVLHFKGEDLRIKKNIKA